MGSNCTESSVPILESGLVNVCRLTDQSTSITMADNVEALNVILDTYRGRCKLLENITKDDALCMTKFHQAQEIYLRILNLGTDLNARLSAF